MKTTNILRSLSMAAMFALTAPGQVITTVAGSGPGPQLGDNQPATQAVIAPEAAVADGTGSLYIADTYQHRVRRVNLATGIIETIAGDGNAAFRGDGGPAVRASLWNPGGLAVDMRGNLYIADTANHRVRRVNLASGVITTVAGNGSSGFSGDAGPATAASLNSPGSLAYDETGLYIADTSNGRIRRLDMTRGTITTVAGGGQGGLLMDNGPALQMTLHNPAGIALDGVGSLYVAERYGHRVTRIMLATSTAVTVSGGLSATDESPSTFASAARLNEPTGVAIGNGSLFILENSPSRVRRIDLLTGRMTPFAGTGNQGFSGDGGPAVLAELENPKALAWSNGSLFITDTGNWRIRRVSGEPAVNRCPAN